MITCPPDQPDKKYILTGKSGKYDGFYEAMLWAYKNCDLYKRECIPPKNRKIFCIPPLENVGDQANDGLGEYIYVLGIKSIYKWKHKPPGHSPTPAAVPSLRILYGGVRGGGASLVS